MALPTVPQFQLPDLSDEQKRFQFAQQIGLLAPQQFTPEAQENIRQKPEFLFNTFTGEALRFDDPIVRRLYQRDVVEKDPGLSASLSYAGSFEELQRQAEGFNRRYGGTPIDLSRLQQGTQPTRELSAGEQADLAATSARAASREQMRAAETQVAIPQPSPEAPQAALGVQQPIQSPVPATVAPVTPQIAPTGVSGGQGAQGAVQPPTGQPTSQFAGFFTVPTGSVGPQGERIYDVFRSDGTKVRGEEAAGLGLTREVIESLPKGQAPLGFKSEFQTFADTQGIDIGDKTETDKFLEELSGDFKELNDSFAEEVAEINENPWISEGLRTRKVAQAEEKYNKKKAGLVDILTLFKDTQDKRTAITEVGGFKVLVDLDTGEVIKELGESLQKQDTQIIEANGRKLLVNAQTGDVIQDFGKVTYAPIRATQGDIEASQISQIEQRLSATRGSDGFVDPNVYISERSKARISPDEFNKRFGSFLSPQERERLGIKSGTNTNAPVAPIDNPYRSNNP